MVDRLFFYALWLTLVAALAVAMPVAGGLALVGGVFVVAKVRVAR